MGPHQALPRRRDRITLEVDVLALQRGEVDAHEGNVKVDDRPLGDGVLVPIIVDNGSNGGDDVELHPVVVGPLGCRAETQRGFPPCGARVREGLGPIAVTFIRNEEHWAR